MDPVRNPYAPGAGQRPPELAGRDEQLAAFDVTLERVAHGRPERSVVLTGLRGVGKTVLLNALRSAAVRADWGTGKLEARPDQPLRRPLASALHMAVRELAPRHRTRRVDEFLGILKAFAPATPAPATQMRDRWNPGIDVPAATGRADSGDIEIDLVELLTDVGRPGARRGHGAWRSSSTRCRTCGPRTSPPCARPATSSPDRLAADRGRRRAAAPAGRAVGASKSYSERLFSYHRIDRLDREAADLALVVPGRATRTSSSRPEALAAMYAATGGYPYFVQAYGKAIWDAAPRVADHRGRRAGRRAGGGGGARRSGSSARATSGRRRPSGSTCGRWPTLAGERRAGTAVPTAASPAHLGRKPRRCRRRATPCIKKGLIYSAERGRIAFTVPHFGRYLRATGPG